MLKQLVPCFPRGRPGLKSELLSQAWLGCGCQLGQQAGDRGNLSLSLSAFQIINRLKEFFPRTALLNETGTSRIIVERQTQDFLNSHLFLPIF